MKNKKFTTTIYILGALILLVLEFLYHRQTVFEMDDLWYATNLATNQPLRSVFDVFEGQVWHYLNWGGRSITHTLLQLIIMGGELFADILNVLVTVLLSFVCALFVKKENRLKAACLASVLLISFNPDIQYSIFWQSGSVNYLYSTIWILSFCFLYLREVGKEETASVTGISFFIIPLGLITGWSNENMGPASFCLAIMTIGYLYKTNKSRIKPWMLMGAAFSLIGSAVCILAPGNFVRKEFINEASLLETLYERLISVMTGACLYLLPSLLCVIILSVILCYFCSQKLNACEILLMITSLLAFGAMFLSPHFPARAAFGIMVINIVLSLKLFERIIENKPLFKNTVFMFFAAVFVHAAMVLAIRI